MSARLVVEWTRSSVRLALVGGRGPRAAIRAMHCQPITAPGEMTSALSAFLTRAKVIPTGRFRWPGRPAAEVIGVIPREQVITRVVKFPATERDELAQMAQLYAKAQLPYPKEQVVMDVFLLAQHEGFSTVAIVACQREIIDRQLAPLREAGLSLVLVTVSAWGVLGWYRRAVRPADAREPSLVVNVDDTRTDLVLIAGGRILSTRSIGQGAHDWSALGDVPALLAVEVERSRAAIRKELPDVDVRSLVLTGVGPLPQWRDEIARRLNLPTVVINAKPPVRLRAAAGEAPLSFSPVVVEGIAKSDLQRALNLSPAEVRAQVRERRQVRELMVVSALAALALLLGSALLAFQVSRERRMVGRLDDALGRVAPAAKELQEKSRSIQLVGSVLQARRQFAATLAGVFHETPTTVTLEGLAFERGRGEVTLKGHAASTQAVLDYLKGLERAPGVGRVGLKYSARRSGPSGERTGFEVVLYQQSPAW
ncbi:MAG: pilus assembly protein PilM [Candidatus Omnitrophica bacterium]|nr:pilus assembly protein PilM [Candidatus Omnitrophota bacterium]